MRYSSQVKPISYLKANAAEILATLGEQRQPLVITQNGEAKAVLQDVASYEATQETLALLKVLALGQQEVAAGQVKPLSDVVARLKTKKALAWWHPSSASCSQRGLSRIWRRSTIPEASLRTPPMPIMFWIG